MTTNDPSTLAEHDLILSFKDHPVRIAMLDGIPWFSLSDLCEAAGYNHHAASVVNRPEFPDHAKRACWEKTDEGRQKGVLVSPVGAFLFTHLNDAARLQSLAAWTRREAKRLCPEPAADDPRMFLTLGPDGTLPPRPLRYSGRFAEWEELRFSPEYFKASLAAQTSNRVSAQAQLLAAAEAHRLAEQSAATEEAR